MTSTPSPEVNITLRLGDTPGYTFIYKEALPDGTPTDPIDLTGYTIEMAFSSGKRDFTEYGGVVAVLTPTEGRVDVTWSESAITNQYLANVRRYRLRAIIGGVPTVIVSGMVVFA